MTPSEALDRIAALCDDAESGRYPTLPAQSFVRTVRKVLAEVDRRSPKQAAIGAALAAAYAEEERVGVTLTPEEAARAASWYYGQADDIVVDDADRALAARLEATR